jgi:predicted DNA-binding transcriptional regulator AlpA
MLLNKTKVAEELGISRQWLDILIKRGDFIPHEIKIGRMILWQKDCVMRWLDSYTPRYGRPKK